MCCNFMILPNGCILNWLQPFLYNNFTGRTSRYSLLFIGFFTAPYRFCMFYCCLYSLNTLYSSWVSVFSVNIIWPSI